VPTRAQLNAWAVANEVDLIFYDPPEYFDHAIVGVVRGYGQEPAVVYDEAQVLKAMTKDMGEDDAIEWFAFNTVGSYVGEATPRFLTYPWDGEQESDDVEEA